MADNRDFKEQDFARDFLSDEELAIANLISKKDHKILPKWKYKLMNVTAALAIIGAITTGLSFVAFAGAKSSELNSLLDKDNPVVKRKELENEILLVRKDMVIADTMVMRMSRAEYNSLNKDIRSINSNIINLQKSSDKNLSRIIELIKSQNNN